LIGSGLEGGGVVTGPPQQPGSINAVGRLILVGLDVLGAASEQGDRTGDIAAGGMRGAHGQLGQALPQRTPRLGGRLPSVLQHFMGMERHAVVEQPLRLDKGLVRRPDNTLGLPRDTGCPARQRPTQPVARALVAGTPSRVAVPIGSLPAIR
jgi:hypothetical protein